MNNAEIAFAKLNGLYKNVVATVRATKYGTPVKETEEFASKYEQIRKVLCKELPDLFDDLPMRPLPEKEELLSIVTYPGGYLHQLIKDMDYIFEVQNKHKQEALSVVNASNKLSQELSDLQKIENLLNRFHLVVRQLKHRHDSRDTLTIRDEYDVQDLLHALLLISFSDVRAEESSPSSAGKASRLDFLLKMEKIVVEAKMTNPRLKDSLVGEQLSVDIMRYQVHPDCKTLVCFVYDPDGFIKNPYALENDLNGRHNELEVRVIIVPKE